MFNTAFPGCGGFFKMFEMPMTSHAKLKCTLWRGEVGLRTSLHTLIFIWRGPFTKQYGQGCEPKLRYVLIQLHRLV